MRERHRMRKHEEPRVVCRSWHLSSRFPDIPWGMGWWRLLGTVNDRVRKGKLHRRYGYKHWKKGAPALTYWYFSFLSLINSSHFKMYKIYWQQIFPFVQLPYRFLLLTVQFYFEALSFLSWLQSHESRVREVESERRHLVCKARSSNTLRTPRYRQLSLIDSLQPMNNKRSLATATHGKHQ